jgi:hypothetical protein
MYKRILAIAVVIALALMVAVPSVFARGGPAKRVTGSVWLQPASGGDGIVRYVEFDAHEAKGDRPVKGHLYWFESGPEGTVEHKLNIDQAMFDYTPFGAPINEGCAFFNGIAYDGPHTGERLCHLVCDWGTPGAAGDWMYSAWGGLGIFALYNVVGGNLVVHFYD